MSKKLRLDFWRGSFWKEKHPLTKVKKLLTGVAGLSGAGAVASSQLDIDQMITMIEVGIGLISTFGAVTAHLIEVWAKATGRIGIDADIDGNEQN